MLRAQGEDTARLQLQQRLKYNLYSEVQHTRIRCYVHQLGTLASVRPSSSHQRFNCRLSSLLFTSHCTRIQTAYNAITILDQGTRANADWAACGPWPLLSSYVRTYKSLIASALLTKRYDSGSCCALAGSFAEPLAGLLACCEVGSSFAMSTSHTSRQRALLPSLEWRHVWAGLLKENATSKRVLWGMGHTTHTQAKVSKPDHAVIHSTTHTGAAQPC